MEGPRHLKPREKEPDPNPLLVVDRGDHYEYHYASHVDFVTKDKKRVIDSNQVAELISDGEGKLHEMGRT